MLEIWKAQLEAQMNLSEADRDVERIKMLEANIAKEMEVISEPMDGVELSDVPNEEDVQAQSEEFPTEGVQEVNTFL